MARQSHRVTYVILEQPKMITGFLFSLWFCSKHASPFEIDRHKEITQELAHETAIVNGVEIKFTQSALEEVKKANANTDYYGFAISYYHFDNELFTKASQKVLDNLKEAENALLKPVPDGYAARKAFGTAVHTTQDFYSHSTWADHNTSPDAIHPSIGKSVLSNPPKEMKFCQDDGVTLLPGVTELTTGYYDVELTDPLLGLTKCNAPPKDKCAHGYKGLFQAPFCFYRPGINKDDTPQGGGLYTRAKNQAIKATKTLLRDFIARPSLSNEEFRIATFFGRTSVAVAMDTTGSMYWHLASVRSAISSQIVNNPSIKKLHPLYILTSFNDPYAQIETVTEDVDVFQAAVNSLVADGGGDCPEMAGAGILLALSQSIPGGQVWVFTDASAKDHSTWSLAIHVALQKRITINFALTGSCSCNDPYPNKHLQISFETFMGVAEEFAITTCTSIHDSMFIGLAQETGGVIYSGLPNHIGNVFDVIDKRIRGDFVTILRSSHYLIPGVINSINVPIYIDETLETVLFSATTYDGAISSVRITQPNGTSISALSPNVTISKLGNNEVATVVGPSVGIWHMEVKGTRLVTIVAQGNSPISIASLAFVTTVPAREGYQYIEVASGNPSLDGNTATALIRVEGPTAPGISFDIVDESGFVLLSSIDVDTKFMATSGELVLSFLPPDYPFSIALAGSTTAGNFFQRLATRVYVPQSIMIAFDESSRPLALPDGNNTILRFVVENFGNESIVLGINVTDDLMYLSSFDPAEVALTANSNATISATLSLPTNCTDERISITATATVRGELLGTSDTAELSHVCEDMPEPSDNTPSPTSSVYSTAAPTSFNATSSPTTALSLSPVTSSPVNTPSPTSSPVTTAPPTSSPVTTASPNSSPDPTASPTSSPVNTPLPTPSPVTTAPPTVSPVTTPSPTSSPVATAPPTSSPVTSASPNSSPDPTASPASSPVTTAPPTSSSGPTASPTSSPVDTPLPTLSPVTTAPPTISPVTTASPTSSTALPTSSPVTTAPTTPSPIATASPTSLPVSTPSSTTTTTTTKTTPTTYSPVKTAPPTYSLATTAPSTSSPVTTDPPTSSPVMTAPPTSSPVTTPPPTLSPVTTPPLTSSPVTKALPTSSPVFTAPPTSFPVIIESPSSSPVTATTTTATSSPVTTAPVTSPPVPAAPTTSSPVTSAPVTQSPVTSVTSFPTSAPVTSSPVTTPPTSSPVTVAPVTSLPTTAPSTPPTLTKKMTIEIDFTLTWNVNCFSINATTLVEIAKIIEESTYNSVDTNLPNDTQLEYAYVYELCNTTVGEHTGYPSSRRLEASTSEIKLYQIVSKECDICQEEMFNDTRAALETVVNDGSLSSSIQNKSRDVMTATIDPNITSSFTVTTSRPTSVPTAAPVTPQVGSKATKRTKSVKDT